MKYIQNDDYGIIYLASLKDQCGIKFSNTSEQQDAHEFLTFLLTHIDDSIKKIMNKHQAFDTPQNKLLRNISSNVLPSTVTVINNFNPIDQLFKLF